MSGQLCGETRRNATRLGMTSSPITGEAFDRFLVSADVGEARRTEAAVIAMGNLHTGGRRGQVRRSALACR